MTKFESLLLVTFRDLKGHMMLDRLPRIKKEILNLERSKFLIIDL